MVSRFIFVSIFILFLAVGTAFARDISTSATHAILIDAETGDVILDKNADEIMKPASMTKIMTAYLIFERLKDGRLALDDTFPVSERAWRKGGSKMFIEVGNSVSVEDLLQGVIVQSGNDASIALAEGIYGSEEDFSAEMNHVAEKLGMADTNFMNATGWPDEEHVTSAKDLAILSRALINNFPEYYQFYQQKSFTYNDIRQGNRNPLLYKNIGADGIKTGHTEESGYGLAASAVRDDRRLILVVNGLDSAAARARESEKLLRWGFREFNNYTLFKSGEMVEAAEVWLGDKARVPLTLDQDLKLTLPRRTRRDVTATVVYEGPVQAPIQEGDQIATLKIDIPGSQTPHEYPLKAAESVSKLSGFARVKAAFNHLLWGGDPLDLAGLAASGG